MNGAAEERVGEGTYECADCDAGCDGGDGACADVACDAAAGCEGAEEEGDLVEGLVGCVSLGGLSLGSAIGWDGMGGGVVGTFAGISCSVC